MVRGIVRTSSATVERVLVAIFCRDRRSRTSRNHSASGWCLVVNYGLEELSQCMGATIADSLELSDVGPPPGANRCPGGKLQVLEAPFSVHKLVERRQIKFKIVGNRFDRQER